MFFDLLDRYAPLSAAGDPPEFLAAVVYFEVFCDPLIAALIRHWLHRGRLQNVHF